MKGKLLFEEEQGFIGTWPWYLTMSVLLGVVGLFGYGIYIQLILGHPWGNQPMSDMALILVSCFSILVSMAVLIFISKHRLMTQVDQGSITIVFKPYFTQPREIRRDQIQKAHVRKYSPLFEYGGWGLRVASKKSRAYNISGNWGLQLLMDDGSKLLIGTRRPGELDIAIEKFNENG